MTIVGMWYPLCGGYPEAVPTRATRVYLHHGCLQQALRGLRHTGSGAQAGHSHVHSFPWRLSNDDIAGKKIRETELWELAENPRNRIMRISWKSALQTKFWELAEFYFLLQRKRVFNDLKWARLSRRHMIRLVEGFYTIWDLALPPSPPPPPPPPTPPRGKKQLKKKEKKRKSLCVGGGRKIKKSKKT